MNQDVRPIERGDGLKALGEGFAALLKEAPVGKLILVLGSLLLALVILFLVGDRVVGYTHYWKLERKMDLIERVDAVESLPIQIQAKVDSLYLEVAEDLSSRSDAGAEANRAIPIFGALAVYYPNGAELIWKGFSALVIPLFFMIWWLVAALVRKPQESSYMGAFIFCSAKCGCSLCIPTIYGKWVNIALNPICQLLVLKMMTGMSTDKND